jgi:hypothetical protein
MYICYEISLNVPRRFMGLPVDFVCSVGDLACLTLSYTEPDNRKVDYLFYDLSKQEWRNDLVPFHSPYRGISEEQLLEAARQLEAEHETGRVVV